MLPPNMALKAVIRNESGHAIRVTGVFGSDAQAAEGCNFIYDSVTIGPHGTAVLGQHEFNMGSWTAHAAVYSIQAEHPQSNHQAQFRPHITNGIQSEVHVTLRESGGRLSLSQSHTVE